MTVPPHDKAEANGDRPADTDPWDGIFRKSGHSYLPWLLADEADPEPRRGEDVGMLDIEDGGIFRCLDCMHEIWDGTCTACGRHYPGHDGGEDWSDNELGLDIASGAEEFDPDDDPGWMGLEHGEGDDEDDGLAIADWYPALPLFRWRFGFDEGDEEDEENDNDNGDDEDAAYESSFIDDENDTRSPLGPMREPSHIYDVIDDSDNDDSHSHVDVDNLSEEEDEPSHTSRRGRTSLIIVSSGEEDEDELDSSFAARPMPSRSRRGRLVESDDELLVLSDDGSHS